MSKLIDNLNSSIKALYDRVRAGEIDANNAVPYIYDIINAAVEVFKDESIRLYVPVYKDGTPAFYQEKDRVYTPVYSDVELADEPDKYDYIETSLNDICCAQYENKTIFDLYDNPEVIYKSDYTAEQVIDYVSKHPRINGIIYNPFTFYVYNFEDWQFMALFMKGIGIEEFSVIDEETGDVKYTL